MSIIMITGTPAWGEKPVESTMLNGMLAFFSPHVDINIYGALYPKDSPLEPSEYHLKGDATLELTRNLSDTTFIRLAPRLNFDSVLTKGSQLFVEDREYRPAFTLHEAVISWYGDQMEIEIGKMIHSWKTADGSSPLDTLNPVDRLDFLEPEKIGVPSLSVLTLFETFQVQAVLLPFFVPDRLPDETNRWLSFNTESKQAFKNRFGLDPVSVDEGRDLPKNKLDRMSFAARASTSTLFTNWDLSLVYQYGYDTAGVYATRINFLTLPNVYQTTEYPDYDLFGISFSTIAGDMEIHGEAGFHDTRDNLKDEDYLAYVVGINYTAYDWLTNWFEEIRIIMEFAGQEVTREREKGSLYADRGLSRGLTSNIISSLEFKIDEDTTIKTGYIFNTVDNDSLADIQFDYKFNGHTSIVCGYQHLSGDSDTFFGQWDDNDKFYTKLTIQF